MKSLGGRNRATAVSAAAKSGFPGGSPYTSRARPTPAPAARTVSIQPPCSRRLTQRLCRRASRLAQPGPPRRRDDQLAAVDAAIGGRWPSGTRDRGARRQVLAEVAVLAPHRAKCVISVRGTHLGGNSTGARGHEGVAADGAVVVMSLCRDIASVARIRNRCQQCSAQSISPESCPAWRARLRTLLGNELRWVARSGRVRRKPRASPPSRWSCGGPSGSH